MKNEQIKNSPYKTRVQVAAELGVSQITIDRALADRRLECYKVGSRVLISQDHVNNFLTKQERKSAAR